MAPCPRGKDSWQCVLSSSVLQNSQSSLRIPYMMHDNLTYWPNDSSTVHVYNKSFFFYFPFFFSWLRNIPNSSIKKHKTKKKSLKVKGQWAHGKLGKQSCLEDRCQQHTWDLKTPPGPGGRKAQGETSALSPGS